MRSMSESQRRKKQQEQHHDEHQNAEHDINERKMSSVSNKKKAMKNLKYEDETVDDDRRDSSSRRISKASSSAAVSGTTPTTSKSSDVVVVGFMDDKEKKRVKMYKRMGKLLAKAWSLEGASIFHPDLGTVGQVLDQKNKYYLPSFKQAWQAFATDLGSVYTTHIHNSKGQHSKLAKDHLEQVKAMLSEKDSSLGEIATKAPPIPKSRKRLSSTSHDPDDPNSLHTQANTSSNLRNNNKKQRIAEATDAETAVTSIAKAPRAAAKANKNPELAEREMRAMEQLKEFIVDKCGGTEDILEGFRVRVTVKGGPKLSGQSKYDINFFSSQNRRFRSMLEVGRFYNLVRDNHSHNDTSTTTRTRTTTQRSSRGQTKEQQAEKKKIRRELDRLRKTLNRATAALDEFAERQTEEQELQVQQQLQPQHVLSQEEDTKEMDMSFDYNDEEGDDGERQIKITRRTCAGTRRCDVTAFPSVPQCLLPDVIMAWDFLCTFQRILLLQPIDLPDFCAALAYQPPSFALRASGGGGGDDLTLAPPVYLVEAHLALLKLLLHDKNSEDWWWSTVETDEMAAVPVDASLPTLLEEDNMDGGCAEKDAREGEDTNNNTKNEKKNHKADAPLIKIDMAVLLNQSEDTLITTSWVKSLEGIAKQRGKAVKKSIQAALKLTRNKWVGAYLRKAIGLFRTVSPQATRRAVVWLVDRVRQARPDLADRSVDSEQVYNQRDKVVEQTMVEMEGLPDSVPTVTDEDAVSEEEEESDEEESDEDDEEEEEEGDGAMRKQNGSQQSNNANERPASSVPAKPLPTLVDLLLPNEKPLDKAEYINPFTWAQMVGAAVLRILHRKKRVWNEVDDSLRANQDLPPLTIPQRRERERYVASRVLTECYGEPNPDDDKDFVERAIDRLCLGHHYLDLTFVQRLCILRLLIEAAYDSARLYEVVVGNYNQRTNAMRLLEQEKKKAKKDAKEKAQQDEIAAREKLAAEAREIFLDEKRDEIRRLNEVSKELSEEMMESLTDEDILEFDEDIKADFEALPTPESFTKAQVSAMVEKMHEEAAFDTDALKVLTLEELLNRERLLLEEMEGQLAGFGGEKAIDDPSLDRETIRTIEGLRREIDKLQAQAEKLPPAREKAIEQLKDAMQDGTIKVLRSAVTAAKKAKLTGPDDETGGIWALDLLRDAALELENAKQNKKLIDAQTDLVAKRNKCFIRTEPLGRDRYGNRFWTFANEDDGNVWAEAEFSLKQDGEDDNVAPPGFADVVRDGNSIIVGVPDQEEDFVDADEKMDPQTCRTFCRKEYHSSGFSPHLVQFHWGCHTSEESLRKVIKSLDGKNFSEQSLKASLKESLEKVEKEATDQLEPQNAPLADEENPSAEKNDDIRCDGDEVAFAEAKREHSGASEISIENLEKMSSALGKKVRVRIQVDGSKDSDIARYETGIVNGWTTKVEKREVQAETEPASESEEFDAKPKMESIRVPIWRVSTEVGNLVMLDGLELLESMSRYESSQTNPSYFEPDASFLGYRNTLGKFTGKPSEAPYSSSPFNFAKLMVKKEGELYPKLKMRSYDEHWGGKSGERASWTNQMKDYAFDTETVKRGMLTLENAFFQLTGGFEGYSSGNDAAPDAIALLDDPVTRVDIELESDKNTPGLWNSPASRAVYIEIVSKSTTTGVLALALELLCRNTLKYLKKHGLINTRSRELIAIEEEFPSRRTRRRNAWQEANHDDWY